MINLELKSQSKNEPTEPVVPSYPCFTLNDSAAESFKKEAGDCDVGDTYEALVRFKVSGIRDDQYGKAVTLDVLEMDEIEHEGDYEPKKSKHKNPAVDAVLKK